MKKYQCLAVMSLALLCLSCQSIRKELSKVQVHPNEQKIENVICVFKVNSNRFEWFAKTLNNAHPGTKPHEEWGERYTLEFEQAPGYQEKIVTNAPKNHINYVKVKWREWKAAPERPIIVEFEAYLSSDRDFVEGEEAFLSQTTLPKISE